MYHRFRSPMQDRLLKDLELHIVNMLEKLKLNDQASVIDIGTGTGYGLSIVRELFPTAKMIGLDLSSEMLRVALRDNCLGL